MIFTITTNLLHLPCLFTLAAAASGSILDIQGHSTPQPNRKNPVGVFPIQNLKSEILNKKDVSWSLDTKKLRFVCLSLFFWSCGFTGLFDEIVSFIKFVSATATVKIFQVIGGRSCRVV